MQIGKQWLKIEIIVAHPLYCNWGPYDEQGKDNILGYLLK